MLECTHTSTFYKHFGATTKSYNYFSPRSLMVKQLQPQTTCFTNSIAIFTATASSPCWILPSSKFILKPKFLIYTKLMWTITGIIIKQINQKIISQLPMLMRRLPPSPGFSFPTVASKAFSWSWVSVTVPALISDDGRPVLALLLRWFSLSSSRFCILYCSRFFLMKSLDGFLGFCAGSSMYSGSGLRIVWRSSLVL